MVIVAALVIGQGLLYPDATAGLRELIWVSMFVILTTPILQCFPIGMDPYIFYAADALSQSHMPWMLTLLINLGLASLVGLMFQLWE